MIKNKGPKSMVFNVQPAIAQRLTCQPESVVSGVLDVRHTLLFLLLIYVYWIFLKNIVQKEFFKEVESLL